MIQSFTALALQANCPAVNLQGLEQARENMLKTIARINGLIRGSKGFIRTFNGTEVRLLVLPEYFLTGFPLQEDIGAWHEKACIDQDGPEYQALAKVAQTNDLFLSGNVYERDENFPGLYFQTSFIIDPAGDVILRYRRLLSMFAPTPHDVLDRYLELYGEDSLFPVVDTEIGRLACVASEEILYPEICRALALRGAEIICHSSSEVSSPQRTPKNTAKLARAYENMVYIVSANSAGISNIPFPSGSTDGHSQVVDFHGAVLGEAGAGESMCGNGEIHLAQLRESRARPGMTNVLARQRLELFAKVYQGESVYPANTLLQGGQCKVPDRSHFSETLEASIGKLKRRRII